MDDVPRTITTGSRLGYDGALIRVRVDTVRFPSGRETTREVVEHPGAVAIVATTGDDRVLFVRQYRQAVGRVLLELPAGTLDSDEAPEVAARRELIEETGHAPERLTELLSFYPSPGYSAERIVIFRAAGCAPVAYERETDEPARPAAIPLADVPSLLEPGDERVRDGKTLIGLLWLLREAGSAPGASV
jgi:ADP-ribose pyrophosphatase